MFRLASCQPHATRFHRFNSATLSSLMIREVERNGSCLSYSPDNTLVALSGQDGIFLLSTTAANSEHDFEVPIEAATVTCVGWGMKSARWLWIGTQQGNVLCWDRSEGKISSSYQVIMITS